MDFKKKILKIRWVTAEKKDFKKSQLFWKSRKISKNHENMFEHFLLKIILKIKKSKFSKFSKFSIFNMISNGKFSKICYDCFRSKYFFENIFENSFQNFWKYFLMIIFLKVVSHYSPSIYPISSDEFHTVAFFSAGLLAPFVFSGKVWVSERLKV